MDLMAEADDTLAGPAGCVLAEDDDGEAMDDIAMLAEAASTFPSLAARLQ